MRWHTSAVNAAAVAIGAQARQMRARGEASMVGVGLEAEPVGVACPQAPVRRKVAVHAAVVANRAARRDHVVGACGGVTWSGRLTPKQACGQGNGWQPLASEAGLSGCSRERESRRARACEQGADGDWGKRRRWRGLHAVERGGDRSPTRGSTGCGPDRVDGQRGRVCRSGPVRNRN
jgi:hypothetical protein